MNPTLLNSQEKKWLLTSKFKRIYDNKEVLIYPMGAERYLSAVLKGKKRAQYDIAADIQDKDVLVIPGYGNTAFLFAEAGAKSVTVYDKDPVTIAWVKAFKKYYHYREYNSQGKPYPSIGELLTALTAWYPPLISLPTGSFKGAVCWLLNPKFLRRIYIFYMLTLVRQALQLSVKHEFELDKNIQFYVGELKDVVQQQKKVTFDTAFVPYLLGVRNGIEHERDIVAFIQQLIQLVPKGHILVNPSRDTKEFHFFGQQYFVTTGHPEIQMIEELKAYVMSGDRYWFKTQGLAVFTAQST